MAYGIPGGRSPDSLNASGALQPNKRAQMGVRQNGTFLPSLPKRKKKKGIRRVDVAVGSTVDLVARLCR